ncbi:MAG: hypothetical protein LC649_01020 [Bacteroidales bacterium]|nr:hypothetical protein [Bacteroidales bacterium]
MNKITREVGVLLMSSIILLISYNNIRYTHNHALNNGSIVTHAHPFDRTGDSSPVKQHDHNRLEMVLISSLSLLVMLTLLVIAAGNIASVATVFTPSRTIISGIAPHTTGRSPPLI